jgi:alpha-1,2-mannosyltransferase
MAGNPGGTSGDIANARIPAGDQGAQPGEADGRGKAGPTGLAGVRPFGHRLTRPGLVIIAATTLALALRLFTLTRPGFLTGVSEYDDGVYLGAAIRLTQGVLPYRSYAFLQPPGMLLLMTPAALVARLTTTATAIAFARVLTVLASTACVPLAGNLVRYRGALVTAVTCGILAVYPDDIAAAHTLLLEPWMNLCCLLAANAAFRRGRIAQPGRLAWAGAALGVAGAVKFWAVVPAVVLLAVCLIVTGQRARRVSAYLAGLAAGFVLLVAPFALAAPAAFVRSTLLYQASRVGTTIPLSLRLAHLTGLIDVLTTGGKLSLLAGSQSLFSSSVVAGLSTVRAGWLPFAVTAIGVAAIAAGYAVSPRGRSHLEWFSLVTMVLAAVLILSYSAFFYHYPAFVAPWLALTAGGAAGSLAGSQRFRRVLVAAFAIVIAGLAVLQVAEVATASVTSSTAIGRLIPKGACVVTDETSIAISADRFASPGPGCSDIIDSLATTLVLSHGISVQGGAAKSASVVAAWQAILGHSDYVWLSGGNPRRIPWTPALTAWFHQNFRSVGPSNPRLGQLYVRDR